MCGSSLFLASQYPRPGVGNSYNVVGMPLITYSSNSLQTTSSILNAFSESFEQPLNSTNHYWIGNGTSPITTSIQKDLLLDPGFEEVSSSSLNPNVNLPSWSIYSSTSNLNVKVLRDTIGNPPSSYSAYINTTYTSTTQASGHVVGGLREGQNYFVQVPNVYITDDPLFNCSSYLRAASNGGGSCTAFYLFANFTLSNAGTTRNLIYIAPITTSGSPSSSHFTNTTNTKYIYNVVTISATSTWYSFSRQLRNDFENIYGTGSSQNYTVSSVAFGNDLYLPQVISGKKPYITSNFDVSLKLGALNNQEQLVNGNFKDKGWIVGEQTYIQSGTYTKTSADYYAPTTCYDMNVQGKGGGYYFDEHAFIVENDSFVTTAYNTDNLTASMALKLVSSSNLGSVMIAHIGVKYQLTSLSNGQNYYVWYCDNVTGWVGPYNDAHNVWYGWTFPKGTWNTITRNLNNDAHGFTGGDPSTWKVTGVMLEVSFVGVWSSSGNPQIEARFDNVRLTKTVPNTLLVGLPQRSKNYALSGSWSLRTYARTDASWAYYQCGVKNTNNSYYVAFPQNMNFSSYFYAAEVPPNATVQVSLAIDDVIYGSSYKDELIYYWGSSQGVSYMFVANTYQIGVSSSIPLATWKNLNVNWTKDAKSYWSLTNPRIEAIGMRVWTQSGLILDVYWDVLTVYGKWLGIQKTIMIQLAGNVTTKQLNITDTWGISGNPLRANSTSGNQWYYKWWQASIFVQNSSNSYPISGNSSSSGMFSYNGKLWNLEDYTALTNWTSYVRYNVTDFKLTNYKKDLQYQNYVIVQYSILFCSPSGSFTISSSSTATAADDPNLYGGTKYWFTSKNGNTYLNYLTSTSNGVFTF
jgi:hypothetical protein